MSDKGDSLPKRTVRPNSTLDWEGINAEKCAALKLSRGSAKSALTMKRNELTRLMCDMNNRDAVEESARALENLFVKFEAVHQQFHALLEDEVDQDESNEYYFAEKRRYDETMSKIVSWLSSVDSLSPSWDVTPEDSISCAPRPKENSHVSSRSSRSSRASSRSSRTKAAAKKAALQAEAESLEKSFRLQEEEMLLNQRKRQLELETEIAKVEAEEEVYAKAEAEDEGSVSTRSPAPRPRAIHSYESFEDEKPLKANPTMRPSQTTGKPETKQCLEMKMKPKPFPVAKPRDSVIRRDVQESTKATNEHLVEQMMQHTLALTLPHPEVPVFAGDPLEYLSFKRAFENLIEKKTASGGSRLYYLVQYTRGEVQELVRSCLTMDEEEGYEEACRLLRSRYGQPYKIAAAYAEKLTTGPQIKADDATALHRFSILLTGCKNTLKQIGYLNKVENPDALRAIVDKLPYRLRLQWCDLVDRITEKEEREATVEDLAKFVTDKARAASHPIYGTKATNDRKSNPRERCATKATTSATKVDPPAATVTNSSKPACPLCKANHWLSQCLGFKKMKWDERIKFIRAERLCDNCLVVGHYARDCPKKAFCKIEGCDKKHSTFLHPKAAPTGESEEPPTNSNDAPSEARNGFVSLATSKNVTGAGVLKVGMAILPVKVRAEGSSEQCIETYAFIDSGSNTTFCTTELMQRLNVKGQKTVLSLTTLSNCKKVKSDLISLEVFDLEENNLVELPVVFSTSTLPVTAADAPNQEEIDKWPHLNGIKLPSIDSTVGLSREDKRAISIFKKSD